MTNSTQCTSNETMYNVAENDPQLLNLVGSQLNKAAGQVTPQDVASYMFMGAYIQSIKQSSTYKFTGANMIVAGLMSDAQEELAHGESERARKTLNRAKAILFEIMDGNLVGTVNR